LLGERRLVRANPSKPGSCTLMLIWGVDFRQANRLAWDG
jgi:hypothetical protein